MRIMDRELEDIRRLVGIGVGAALALVAGCAMVASMLLSSPRVWADTPTPPPDLHGINFLKGCDSPTVVGQPYICTFQAINTVDTAHDTLTITSVVDVVHAGSGDVTSANLLPTPTLLTLGGGQPATLARHFVPFRSALPSPLLLASTMLLPVIQTH